MVKKTSSLLIFILILGIKAWGQDQSTDTVRITESIKFRCSSLIIPSILITYGFIGIDNDRLRLINKEIRDELRENIDERATIDDFSQYAPILSIYGLNAIGVKGRSDLRDRTTILISSYAMMGATITTIKSITKIKRPDGSSNNSFPSGHTATAFMGAELLWQEYKDVSVWYGIAGYAIAAGTGFYRIHNERHWLTDVAAGAGIGIVSAKVAYWLNPYINRKLFKRNRADKSFAIAYPFYNKQQYGARLTLCF